MDPMVGRVGLVGFECTRDSIDIVALVPWVSLFPMIQEAFLYCISAQEMSEGGT
jgi:hypothetical protein